jgi:hypothetical protein
VDGNNEFIILPFKKKKKGMPIVGGKIVFVMGPF